MKRQVISSVVAGCALFVVIAMVSRSGSTQSAISDCLEPFGNPPCNANNNATFNNGKTTGCKVEFHWLRCDGVSHGSVFDSCTNINCKGSCSCSCATNGYGVSWQDTCSDVVKSQSFSCNRCGAPSPTPTSTPTPEPPPPPEECNVFPSVCDPPDGWSWDWCCCVNDYLLNNGSWPCTDTPVIYDSNHNGLNLSDAEHGVAFDIDANGSLDVIGWPLDPDDKFLVYDRNGNGRVDDAKELFGNKTPQPDSTSGSAQNGFLALAEFDKLKNGGNADGLFSLADSGFSLLRLWSDKNRNSTSEPDELETLPADLVIELKYHVMNKQDRNGNRLRYRSGKWVWDVIFVRVNPFKRSKPHSVQL